MVYRKSIFERNGKYKYLHLLTDDRACPSLVESAESESIFDMSRTPIQVFPFIHITNPTEQDYLAERNRLEQDGWAFLGEGYAPINSGGLRVTAPRVVVFLSR
jgi:hypothetical protein